MAGDTSNLTCNHPLASPVSAEQISPTVAAKPPLSFLSLPPEVRNMIYDLALVSEHPLDLWPNRHVRNFRSMSSRKCHGQHRVCRADVTCTCEWKWTGKSREKIHRKGDCRICTSDAGEDCYELSERTCPLGNHRFPRLGSAPYHVYELNADRTDGYYLSGAFFRDQQDLHFIRKSLATGLLRTSKLVRFEAVPYFFGNNSFKFSSVGSWEGLLRFFLTIGPDARRFISSLGVVSPYGKFWWPKKPFTRHAVGRIDQNLHARSKNDPKLHMAKIAPGQNLASIVEQVCRIILEDNVIRYLDLIIFEGCYQGLSQPSVDRIGRLRLPVLSQVTLVSERNSFITDANVVARVKNLEWNSICQPGSYSRRSGSSVWQYQSAVERSHDKYGYLEGLAILFEGADEIPRSYLSRPVGRKSEPWVFVEARLWEHHLRKYGY
ncbi:MAG: hypothetical protein Q9208_006396 [Pyrenodesmia sp. 3 TL-2023]